MLPLDSVCRDQNVVSRKLHVPRRYQYHWEYASARRLGGGSTLLMGDCRWVEGHLPAVRFACALIRADAGTAAPHMVYRDITSVRAKVRSHLHVHITGMKMPSAWWRRAR